MWSLGVPGRKCLWELMAPQRDEERKAEQVSWKDLAGSATSGRVPRRKGERKGSFEQAATGL